MIATSFTDALFLSAGRVRVLLVMALVNVTLLVSVTLLPVLGGSDLNRVFQMLEAVGVLWVIGLALYGCAYGLRAVRTSRALHTSEWSGIHSLHGRMDFSLLRDQLRYAAPLGISAALGALSRWLDKIVISSYFPPDVYAAFEAGAREIPFIPVFLGSISTVLLSELNRIGGSEGEISSDNRRAMLHLWNVATMRVATVMIPLSVFLFVFADQIIPFMFSAKLSGAVPPFRIYLLMLPLRIAAYGPMIMALGRPRLVLWGSIGDLSGSLILSLLFVHWIGILGPAISTVIMTYAQVGFLVWMIRNTVGVRWREMFPWRRLGKISAASLCALGLSIPILGWNQPPVSLVVGAIPFGMAVLWLNRRFGRSYSS